MKRVLSILFTLITPLSMYAFHYRPEIDGDGRLFFVTGDNAVSGIVMLIVCSIIAFICLKLAIFIDKDEGSKGIRHYITMILYITGTIAIIAAIGIAYVLWWIILILFIICVLGVAIYQKITENNNSDKNSYNNQETDIKEKTIVTSKIEKHKKEFLSNKTDLNAIKIEIENKIKEIDNSEVKHVVKQAFDINCLTPQQRCATFGLIAYLGKRLFESNQEDADKIINTYAEILQISKEDYNFIMSGIRFSRFFEYFCDIEKIKMDEYWNFLFKAWRELIDKDTGKRKLLYYKLYKTMKKALYFTNEEIDAVLQGKDIYKYNY